MDGAWEGCSLHTEEGSGDGTSPSTENNLVFFCDLWHTCMLISLQVRRALTKILRLTGETFILVFSLPATCLDAMTFDRRNGWFITKLQGLSVHLLYSLSHMPKSSFLVTTKHIASRN